MSEYTYSFVELIIKLLGIFIYETIGTIGVTSPKLLETKLILLSPLI